MAVHIPAPIWNFILAGVQTAFTRGLLLLERGATDAEIRAHIEQMKAENNVQQAELDRLRRENP